MGRFGDEGDRVALDEVAAFLEVGALGEGEADTFGQGIGGDAVRGDLEAGIELAGGDRINGA